MYIFGRPLSTNITNVSHHELHCFHSADSETYYYTTRPLHALFTLAKRFTRDVKLFTCSSNNTHIARNSERFALTLNEFHETFLARNSCLLFTRFGHALISLQADFSSDYKNYFKMTRYNIYNKYR